MRLRFTIRDLLWLAVVAALATGWWLEHRRANRYMSVLQELRSADLIDPSQQRKLDEFLRDPRHDSATF